MTFDIKEPVTIAWRSRVRFPRPYKLLASRRRIIISAIACLVLLGYVDWSTGPNVAVTCFYLIPVCLLSWFWGKRVGYAVAAIHAFIWFAIDLELIPVHSPIIYWNAVVRFITFAVVVWLIDLCKNLSREIERLVEDKTAVLEREVETRTTAEDAIRKLAVQLSAAEDAERRRLGQELHDAFGQSLSLLKLQLQTTAAALPEPSSQSADLNRSVTLVSSLIQQARTLTFELYPSMLDELGLVPALTHYARQLSEQLQIQITVADAGPSLALPLAMSSFLFRAVRELITNAYKHGKATQIVIQVRREPDHIRIVVNDNGKGFSRSQDKGGLGLSWIRERVGSFGGTCEVESTPTQGASVLLELKTSK